MSWTEKARSGSREQMLVYYDERAAEYDEIYTLGKGPASIPDPQTYLAEAAVLLEIVRTHARGNLMDIACGTGYWMPGYARQCAPVVLFDQSPRMLDQCHRRARELSIESKCRFVQGDVFAGLEGCGRFDTALIGFFLSHVPPEDESRFFGILGRLLNPSGRLLILDSVWSPERAKARAKSGTQQRRLNDGRTFEIYKRYFDHEEIERMAQAHGIHLSVASFGRTFLAVEGWFENQQSEGHEGQ